MTTSTLPHFDQWAAVYDDQPNPLLRLEERHLPALMPPIAGADILDVGCGTGRQLQLLESRSPRSLTGIDPSPSMLEHARRKLSPSTRLHNGDSSALPGAEAAYHLVLASFVLSYIDDLPAFAAECSRVLSPGGHLLLSDMHPVTAAQRGWQRSFHTNTSSVHLDPHSRSLVEIIAAFRPQGFELVTTTEACFAEPERDAFAHAGKLAEYEALRETPAIYLLKLRKTTLLQLYNAPWATSARTWSTAPLASIDGRLTLDTPPPTPASLDLTGYVLLPGLINAHDHLEFALFPNLGRAVPFANATEWAHHIHATHSALIQQHRQVPLPVRLWWGAIRNLLAGVTTVCHHNPLYPDLTAPGFPVRVLTDFAWAHSPAFDPDLADKAHAAAPDQPFILHAAEGTSPMSRDELHQLDDLQLLNARTVLVHGLALTLDDAALLNRRSASLILCPSSNHFLFETIPSAALITAIDRVALGSDSPLTAAGDLLDELSLLGHLDPDTIYSFVTTSAAQILRLPEGQGQLLPGGPADLIAVRDHHTTPARTLAALTLADVELVLLGGTVQLASPTLYNRLTPGQQTGLHQLEIDGHRRYLRAPLPWLFAAAEAVLGRDALRLGGKEVHHLPPL